MNSGKEPTAIQRLAERFQSSLSALGAQVDEARLEGWCVLVHACMSGQGRMFHNVEHVFQVSAGGDALATLAALFHDTVYYQVDGGLRQLGPLLEDAIEVGADGIRLRPVPAEDRLRALVVDVFGFQAGQVLSPFGGLNELLSALLAARQMADVLPLAAHAQVAACIEATIPFRKPDAQGVGAAEKLEQRLLALDARLKLGLGQAGVEAAVHRAVEVANRDVANFAFEDPGAFLDNTWALLPESNANLRLGVYTIRDYLTAMQKMEGFFSFLDPGVVFAAYRGRPEPRVLEQMSARARKNVEVGRRYLRAKLVAAGVLRALAELTGGDAPVALLMGDLPHDGSDPLRMEDALPAAPPAPASDVQADVLALLREGRARPSGFDLKNSPLAAFLYAGLGDAALDRVAQLVKAPEQGPERQRELLSALPAPLLRAVIASCLPVATTRATRLRALLPA